MREALKLEAVSASTPAMVLEPRQLARLVEVFLKFPDLPAQVSTYTVDVDYSVLTADELEELRRLRDKARGALSAPLPETNGQARGRTNDGSG